MAFNSQSWSGVPSRAIVPEDGSIILMANCRMVDLPLPVRPVMPTVSPAFTEKLTWFKA